MLARRAVKKIIFLVPLFLWQMQALAQFRSKQDSPSVFLELGIGLTTYKSLVVESNDTANSQGYRLGINGGQEKNLSMFVNNESTSTNFIYAGSEEKSQIDTTFFDTVLRYYWGPFYFGAIFSQSSIVTLKQDVELTNATGSGMGGNLGLEFYINRNTLLFIDLLSVNTGDVIDSIQELETTTVSIGSRTEFFLGGSIRVLKDHFTLIIGYKYRSFSLTVGSDSYNELQTATWIGLGMNRSL